MRRTASFRAGAVLGFLLAGAIALLGVAPAALAHWHTARLEGLYGDFAANTVSGWLARSGPAGGDATRGQAVYASTCAQCHGADGTGSGIWGATTRPAAIDLTSDRTRGKSDAQLGWIVSNGLGFTTMPAYGAQLPSMDVADVVAYVRTLERDR